MKSLNLTFKGSLGKAHTLKLGYANDNLDAKTVKNTMDQLAALDLFVANGEKKFTLNLFLLSTLKQLLHQFTQLLKNQFLLFN